MTSRAETTAAARSEPEIRCASRRTTSASSNSEATPGTASATAGAAPSASGPATSTGQASVVRTASDPSACRWSPRPESADRAAASTMNASSQGESGANHRTASETTISAASTARAAQRARESRDSPFKPGHSRSRERRRSNDNRATTNPPAPRPPTPSLELLVTTTPTLKTSEEGGRESCGAKGATRPPSEASRWYPRRDSNPCLRLERATS